MQGADMEIVCLLFDRITALDLVGPCEVLQRLPGARLTFVARRAGPVWSEGMGLTLVADRPLAEVRSADLLLVPGGLGTRRLECDQALLEWIRAVDATTWFTASVCTGSLLIAAAGLLDGQPATTHWAQLERLRDYGAIPTARRVIQAGRRFTAAGVSAGIDMALLLAAHVAGDDCARAIQLGIEYDPCPPFDCGSPSKAPPALRELVAAAIAARSFEAAAPQDPPRAGRAAG
jgi:transcriptional regulator GlxA family with amidase domain